jgi:hypothetical protein
MPDWMPDPSRREAIAAELQARFERVKDFPERMPDGMARMLELRQIIPDVLNELRRDSPSEIVGAGLQGRFEFEV